MLDNLLGKKDELEFRSHKFKGLLAGKAWTYSRNVDGLIRTRAIIFLMTLLVFYPIVINYLLHDVFFPDMFAERAVFSIMFLIAGLLFNKQRILSIILASIPLLLIVLSYIIETAHFDYRKVGFTFGILVLVLLGIYHDAKVKNLKKELSKHLLENQLIDNQ